MEFVIPEELLVNILVRLPIKDVLRSKVVCKSWLRLISTDPYFTRNYVRNTAFTLVFRVQHNIDNPEKLFYSLIEFARENSHHHHHIPITPPDIPDHQNNTFSFLSFIGSFDGSTFILHLNCFANDHGVYRVYSFNPVLGSCVKLVVEDKIRTWEPTRKYVVGFIPSNNTIKLLRFGKVRGVEKTEIFTVGGLDWRKLDDPLLFYDAFNSNYRGRLVCFNGAYHWLSSIDGDDDGIFTFNLLEEKSGAKIPKPHGMSQRRLSITLTILKDRLSLAELIGKCSTMVIWSMREYGVVESWSKLIVLTLYEMYPEKSRNYYLVPIAELANGDILFYERSIEGGMCFYNLEERRLTPIDDHPVSSYENTYVPRFYT